MKLYYLLASVLLATPYLINSNVMASSDHDHHDHSIHDEDEFKKEDLHAHHGHAEVIENEGPHGGRLLEEDDYAVEVTIFENGTPPEMRLYAYKNDKILEPDQVENLFITLFRLDGSKDEVRFTPEKDYWVGNQVINEPHSYEVEVEAKIQGNVFHWHYENHEGRAEISDRLIALSGVKTESVGPRTLHFKETLFGVIEIPQDKRFQVFARYQGMVERITVNVGDKVTKGQVLATILNTQTLQRYNVKSPASGEVIQRLTNAGDKAADNALLVVADLSTVWVEMSAFPESIEKLQIRQPVIVKDLHQHEKVNGEVTYISPVMTGGHIARARAVIDNENGHWRPGMHVKADIEVEQRDVELAVKNTALQNFRDMPVVFARYGNIFEVRMLELGETDDEYFEVLEGIKPKTEYVTENSFLLKAEVLKDGASHDH